jgi:ATP-dependent Clp protease adaptor protein ClpS
MPDGSTSPNHDDRGNSAAAAVLPAKPKPTATPKAQPPYAVVIFNDPDHTFAYVIEVLQRVFGYDLTKAMELTLEAHESDRATVWSGPLETAEFKRDRIRGFGPDTYARRIVTMPLGCAIEPLPQ